MSRRRKQKPLFKKRRTPEQTTLRIVVAILVMAVVLFVGISVAKPLIERFAPDSRHQETPPSADTPDEPIEQEELSTTPPTSSPEEITAPTTTQPPVIKQGIYYFSFPSDGDAESNIRLLSDAIALASSENYQGFCIELISVGGKVNYASANELAIDSEAVSASALPLSDMVAAIQDRGLVPYARISALTDHIASWRDRSICYLFEDSTSKWLDNKLEDGGQPWISPFRDAAKEYISSLTAEITDAGFAGLIAGELDFPPFRSKDLSYVGAIVQSPTRYTALCDFSNLLADTVGSAKSYIIEVDAHRLLAGECEILSDPSLLNSKTVYVRYDSSAIGTRLEKSDGDIISFEGLSEDRKLIQVYRLVNTQLSSYGLRIIPSVDSRLSPSEIYSALGEVGFKPDQILIY